MTGFIARHDFVMAPRSFLRPEFIQYANKEQDAPNPYDVNITATKLEAISQRKKGNKFKRDHDFHETLNRFLERREAVGNVPPPTRLKAKANKDSNYYKDVTRETAFQDAYTGTLAALRKVKKETDAEEEEAILSATATAATLATKKTKPQPPAQLTSIIRQAKLRKLLREAEAEERTRHFNQPPYTPKTTHTGLRYGQSGKGVKAYKYVTSFDTPTHTYTL